MIIEIVTVQSHTLCHVSALCLTGVCGGVSVFAKKFSFQKIYLSYIGSQLNSNCPHS